MKLPAILIVLLLALPATSPAQSARRPLTEAEIIDLLHNSVPSPRLQELVRKFGISFQMTRDTERDLKEAGADDELLSVLHDVAPGAAHAPSNPLATPPSPTTNAPPTLEVQSDPGNSSVYVDDEPVGTTSSEGRLRLTRFTPGKHRVRVSHAGFQDVEQETQLTAGQTATVFANLQATQKKNPLATPPSTPTVGGGSASITPPGSLGMFLLPAEGGAQGMAVGAVVPGSPAASAGVSPGDLVLSIGGHLIKNAQDVSSVMGGRREGESLEVTFKSPSGVQTRKVELAGPGVYAGLMRFRVNHDHGSSFCTGWLTLVGDHVIYVGEVPASYGNASIPVHNFAFSVHDIKEIKKNPFYLAIFQAFHIKLKDGDNMNFVLVDANNKPQNPKDLIETLRKAGAGR